MSILNDEDWGSIVDLISNCASISDFAVQKRQFFDSLAKLIDADYWLETYLLIEGNEPPKILNTLNNYSEKIQQIFITGTSDIVAMDPSFPIIVQRFTSGNFDTFTRQDILTDKEWYESAHYKKYRLEAGIDHFIYQGHKINETLVHGTGLVRKVGREPFTEREVHIYDQTIKRAKFIYKDLSPRNNGEYIQDLQPRQFETLRFLAEGFSNKDLAQKMGLSEHTVRTYVKDLQKHFTASSRQELIARFYTGTL